MVGRAFATVRMDSIPMKTIEFYVSVNSSVDPSEVRKKIRALTSVVEVSVGRIFEGTAPARPLDKETIDL